MLIHVDRIAKSHRSFRLSQGEYTNLLEKHTRDRSLRLGKILHTHLIINGLAHLTHFSSKLILFYVECRQLSDARNLFDKIPQTNIRRWVVLIGAYARLGFHREAMDAFYGMQREGVKPNEYVFPSVLKACGHLVNEQTGREIHCEVLKYGFENDAFVNSALIDMYSKCREVEKARRVLDEMGEKDVVTLNAMVSGYVHHGFIDEAFHLVEEMRAMGSKTNLITWNSLIAGFSRSSDEAKVFEIFRLMRGCGIEPDVVTWTSIISGFVQNFRNDKAFDTFKQMIEIRLCPSSNTLSVLLPACATVADCKHGREIHSYALKARMDEDVYVRSALIDMYAKCGFVDEARTLFDKTSQRNTVTWNSMIFGYANHGYCTEAIELFDQMLENKEELDHLTFTAALTACSHAGKLELGNNLFERMQEKFEIKPRLEHYACMVDLLGKAGKIDDAYVLIKTMPIEPDLFVWGALLGACKQHGIVDLAEVAAKHLRELEPNSRGSSLLLKTLYADAGLWGNVVKTKKMMKKRKLPHYTGCSWI